MTIELIESRSLIKSKSFTLNTCVIPVVQREYKIINESRKWHLMYTFCIEHGHAILEFDSMPLINKLFELIHDRESKWWLDQMEQVE